ncbi:gamma carbonic anhydrase family protein [Caenibacillus caldisaponilyticus]|jgi:carbonic anhydrase/acetyltransferase-like protein (isoleucine patch superfamily)|uniref:gamma carbonic anhydrase family protein n=1 Tax=Caenibacillus caldisaponilyticus TaxID=1674942 RepID=UPI0009886C10|nr:gamma carbonic anhydrase family protein [Caenibacillus caldisaponilyticus]
MLLKFQSHVPNVHESVYVAEGAKIIGDVTIGERSSVWFNTVIRGDEGPITIGRRCNIQDNCMIHLYEGFPVVLEDEVSVGHNAILHGCIVRRGALIGMGATVLDGAEIGEEAFIAAGALVPPGKKIPPRTMVMGAPGKVVRELTERDFQTLKATVEIYEQKAQIFKAEQNQRA